MPRDGPVVPAHVPPVPYVPLLKYLVGPPMEMLPETPAVPRVPSLITSLVTLQIYATSGTVPLYLMYVPWFVVNGENGDIACRLFEVGDGSHKKKKDDSNR